MERPGAITIEGKPYAVVGAELKTGDKAPDFSVVDSGNKPVQFTDLAKRVRIFSVVPSLDTPVCDAQTRRFNLEADRLSGVDIYTVSMDLPFAQRRWCRDFVVDKVRMLSDHRSASFGAGWGTLIKDLRLLSRALFVVGPDDVVRYAEYVTELTEHPNYEAALAAAQSARAQSA